MIEFHLAVVAARIFSEESPPFGNLGTSTRLWPYVKPLYFARYVRPN